MSKPRQIIRSALIFLAGVLPALAGPIVQAIPGLPLRFEPAPSNGSHFLAHGRGYTLEYPRPRKYLLSHWEAWAGFAPNRFSGALETASITGETPLPSRTNYFSGSSPEGWRTNVPNYERVRIRELFRHVDLVFHGSEGVIEYDFVAHPGADLTAIRFQILGARRLRVEANGSLLVVRNRETIRWKAPAIYQANGATRVAVTGRYEIGPHHTVAFRVGTYDPTRELIIDPVLAYASYLGGSGKELARAVATDAAETFT